MNILRMDEFLLATRNMGKERKGEREQEGTEGKMREKYSTCLHPKMLPPTILPIGPRF